MNPESSSPSRQDPPHITMEIPKTLQPHPIVQTCPICTIDSPANEILTPLPCHHSFCSTCLKEYLSLRINLNQVLNILCPQSGCSYKFTDKTLEGILDPEMYTRYQTFVANKLALKGTRQHYCPNPRCSVLFTPQKSKKFTVCTSCGTKICKRCDNPYHEGKSCMEAMDPDFAKYIKENKAKFCMICKTIEERDGGCEQITCSVCGYHWCWVCGRNYERMHVCKGIWDPVPPTGDISLKAKIKRVREEGPIIKYIGLILLLVLVSPFLLLGYMILRANGRVEVSKHRPLTSCCSIFMAIVWTPIAWLSFALFLLVLSPLYLIDWIGSCFQRRGKPKEEDQPQLAQTVQPEKSQKIGDSQNIVENSLTVNVPLSS